MDYSTLRSLHIGCAALSIGLFASRGALQLLGVDWRRWRWLRILPHANDTVLLTAAVSLAVLSGQYPLARPWLTAKVVALVLYVVLGRIALQPRPGRRLHLPAWLAALACAGYIVGVAVTRSPSLGLGA
ncbi:putative membrane protein SirB2 [Sphaerotilus hippei]|uniref:Putative membrane protein SirB2 n=1 Tax=Sphaerotilus hippei TaxID=744406 RepID=A0A318GV81_9BURK|nr:SirB2 family protein [Sphaerotilus hippei]PXW93359.1 putative membrane protein SirB2 [Sphaerotilus hippei]